ncbi:MAG TPA: NAD(P)/FAD-dependent oxidoreductase [Candidatus Korarchaeota archaeon]|nr:NAD(P)/FAD-dependent oxidoreductase [Candidatus Korarchaeota archaeon]
MEWDIIIVGGGPAGLSAARYSSELGLKTLLFEAYSDIKAWKPCGEGVSKETFKTAGIEPKPGIVTNELNMRVYAPSGKYVEIPLHGFAINKDLFLQEMGKEALKAGAEFRIGERVESVVKENGKVVGVKTSRGEVVKAKVVIGADGYNSVVAKTAGLDNSTELIPVYQYKMVGVEMDSYTTGHIYVGSMAPGGYAWIFPKDEEIANVGIGVRPGAPKAYLDKFIKERPELFKDAKIMGAGGAAVPIGGMAKEYIADGVILLGDAAGMVIPFTGAGIHSSIAAGKIASKVIKEAIERGDTSVKALSVFVKGYESWIKRINDSLKAMRVFERLGDADLNLLAEVLDYEDVVNLANGMNLGKVAMKLMKHPILATKVAKALL